jgi:IS5 family transposase
MQRINVQPTFTDAAVAELGGPRTTAFLARCQALVPWDELAGSIAHLFPAQPKGGRPFWPAVTMLKCVMLQKWFDLSDPQAEEQLRDRISFRRFVGLSFDDATPDETTFVTFRQRLRDAGCASTLFDKVVAVMDARGLILRTGTIVDATIVDAPMGHRVADDASEADGGASGSASASASASGGGGSGGGLERHTRDRCASYTKNHGTLRHGYKANVATDARGTITDWVFDTASVHDSNHVDALTERERHAVYADSAYRSKEREARLRARGVACMITHKRVRGQARLSDEQRAHNRACSTVRAFVEHPRAWMVKMGYTAVRYRGLVRNALDFALTAVAYNLKRSFHLLGQPLTPARATT